MRSGLSGEIDVLMESIFGEDSEYKQWIKRLYDLGFIPQVLNH